MADQTWQDKTDNTLERIEGQADSGEKQTGFAQDFREKVITSLTKIEVALEQNEKDHTEIKAVVGKIPAMELGLNNHLHSHDRIKTYIYYPVAVGIILILAGLFCRVILKVL
jgi:undecaprenyl pyrophosphate phosphatase UppP